MSTITTFVSGGHVKGVGPPVLPMEVAELMFPRLALHRLRQRDPELQQVGDGLVGPQQPVEADVAKALHSSRDIGFREGVGTIAAADAVERGELLRQDLVKQDVGAAVAALPVGLGARQISPPEGGERMQCLELRAAGFGQGEIGAGRAGHRGARRDRGNR